MDTPTRPHMWSEPAEDQVLLDEDCSPTKTCRNMVGISFEGLAEEGADIHTAWKATLEAEGKMVSGAESLRDLVLGSTDA